MLYNTINASTIQNFNLIIIKHIIPNRHNKLCHAYKLVIKQLKSSLQIIKNVKKKSKNQKFNKFLKFLKIKTNSKEKT
jgi:hypothetical protein